MAKRKVVPLDSLNDAVGRPLAIGDFVTAVWTNNVELFEVIGFEKKWHDESILLKRKFDSGDINPATASATVRRSEDQVTWVDPMWLMQKAFQQ